MREIDGGDDEDLLAREVTVDRFRELRCRRKVKLDDGGSVCIKAAEPYHDPVELAEHEALELANLLIRLARPV